MTGNMKDARNEDAQENPYLTRRQFIKSTAAGAAAIYLAPSMALGLDDSGNAVKSRVVRVRHENLINPDERVNIRYARQCVDEALLMLTQKKEMKDAWTQIFPNLKSEDTIGLKVNCISGKCPTHPEIAYSLAQSLIDALGINPNNIIIWDRTISELKKTGYTVNQSKKGIRCTGTVESFSVVRWIMNMDQDESDGVGYDNSLSVDVGEGVSSHLSNILTRMCTYLINVPVLKDHSLAGITLSLKNHFGTIDNPRDCHPNDCDPFIAKLNATPQIRDKTKLVVCDAAFGVYEGGPRGAPQWQPKSILAATDPVALDYTGMLMINGQRKKNDLDPVTAMAVHLKTAEALGLGTCNPKKIAYEESVLS
ncbi:MAG: DUF362 domain-containing protein [Deltaproteobacteria bacterium]|nr:DUF362 domain-containing protein [Deltaproteobacteria bacterium]